MKSFELKMTKPQNNIYELEAFKVFKWKFKYCTITFIMFWLVFIIGSGCWRDIINSSYSINFYKKI